MSNQLKPIGITRQLDDLGRVVIPKETRRMLGWDADTTLEFFMDGDYVVLGRYSPGCIFCGEIENTVEVNGKKVCMSCMKAAAAEFKAQMRP